MEDFNEVEPIEITEMDYQPEKISKQKAIKGSVYITLFNYISNIADFIIVIYSSFIFTIDQMGLYNLLLQYVPIVTILIGFGMINTATKFITKFDNSNQRGKSAAIAYMITLINTTIAVLISLIFITWKTYFSELLTGETIYSNYIFLLGLRFLVIPQQIIGQLFISRYEFKIYLAGRLIGKIINVVSLFIFFKIMHDISAFFYATILGEGFIFIFFIINIFRIYRHPEFSISIKELFQYSSLLFIAQILIYIKQYVSNLIFYIYFQNLSDLGLLYYIKLFFNMVNIFFNSLHSVLVVYYAKILYKEDPIEEFRKETFMISKFFQFVSIFIMMLYVGISPVFIKFITGIFHYTEKFEIGTITMMLFGLYFFFSIFYYISPTIINIHEGSNVLLKLHALSIIIYLGSYLLLIKYLGMPGIPIAQILGFISFLYLCKKDITKKYKIGFDKQSFKILSFASIPFLILILASFPMISNDPFMTLAIGSFQIVIPINSIIYTIVSFIIGFGIFIIILRKQEIFVQSDIAFFKEMFGPKISKLLQRILVKQKK